MTVINYVINGEEGNATVLNRPLREALTALGLNPDDVSSPWPLVAHNHAAANITSGQLAMARLASGAPDGTKFIRDDGVLAVPSSGGSTTFPIVLSRAVSAYIELPASAIWATEVPTQFTIEFLLFIFNFATSFNGFIALGTGGDSFIIHDATGIVQMYPHAVSGVSDYPLVREGRVRRFSLSRNGAAIRLYLDGIFVIEGVLASAAPITLSGTQRRLMGDGSGEGMSMQGMGDFRIWSTVRTDQQILDNAFVRLVGNETGLIHYLKIDEGAGSALNDSGPNNWDGTINGNTSWITGRV